MKKENLEEELKETKEQVEKLKKTNKKSNLLLVVLICVVMVACGYGFGYMIGTHLADSENNETLEKEEDKSNEKENEDDKENDEKVESEKLDVNSAVVKNLFEIFREDSDDAYNYSKSEVNTNMEVRRRIAFSQLDDSVFVEKTCGSLSANYYYKKDDGDYFCGSYDTISEKALAYWYDGYNKNYDKEVVNVKVNAFSASALEEKYKEIFGKDAEYENESFNIVSCMVLAYYDSENKLYASFGSIGGLEFLPEREQTIESVNHVGENLTINTKLVETYDIDGENSDETISYITYTFKYEKATGNYIFVSRIEK